jgi:hypothetical protein
VREKKLEAALATKTRAQLTAKTTGLMIHTDGLVGAAKTAESDSARAGPLRMSWRPRGQSSDRSGKPRSGGESEKEGQV